MRFLLLTMLILLMLLVDPSTTNSPANAASIDGAIGGGHSFRFGDARYHVTSTISTPVVSLSSSREDERVVVTLLLKVLVCVVNLCLLW